MPGEISRSGPGLIEHLADQPCECFLPESERTWKSDPASARCRPCHARSCLKAIDDWFKERGETEVK